VRTTTRDQVDREIAGEAFVGEGNGAFEIGFWLARQRDDGEQRAERFFAKQRFARVVREEVNDWGRLPAGQTREALGGAGVIRDETERRVKGVRCATATPVAGPIAPAGSESAARRS